MLLAYANPKTSRNSLGLVGPLTKLCALAGGVKERMGAPASYADACAITGGPISLASAAARSSGAMFAGEAACAEAAAWTGTTGSSGTTPNTSASAQWRNRCQDMVRELAHFRVDAPRQSTLPVNGLQGLRIAPSEAEPTSVAYLASTPLR